MSHDAQMLKGVLALMLLRLIDERDDYGYALVVRLQQAGFAELGEGTVYPALTRLESARLLTSRLVKSASGPTRKYYALTAAGAAELARAEMAWAGLVERVGHVHTTGSST